mmetsp:Transcript_21899/g.34015  ORF Transcript_21899/g.34015 Transcript_21899/m.34015 type:complete len:108 (-) Transcript_21899:3047-3370(-)
MVFLLFFLVFFIVLGLLFFLAFLLSKQVDLLLALLRVLYLTYLGRLPLIVKINHPLVEPTLFFFLVNLWILLQNLREYEGEIGGLQLVKLVRLKVNYFQVRVSGNRS